MNSDSAYRSNSENYKHSKEPLSGFTAFIRLILGLALSAAGSYVIFQVLIKIRDTLQNPESLTIFNTLLPADPAMRTIVFKGEEIILPLASFQYFSYGICILLFVVAGMLGGSLLKRGIWLLVP